MTGTIDQLAEHIGLELRDNSTIAVIRKIESDLAYRTPGSNRPLAHVVLPRAQAECLLEAIHARVGDEMRAARKFGDEKREAERWLSVLFCAVDITGLPDKAQGIRLRELLRTQFADVDHGARIGDIQASAAYAIERLLQALTTEDPQKPREADRRGGSPLKLVKAADPAKPEGAL